MKGHNHAERVMFTFQRTNSELKTVGWIKSSFDSIYINREGFESDTPAQMIYSIDENGHFCHAQINVFAINTV